MTISDERMYNLVDDVIGACVQLGQDKRSDGQPEIRLLHEAIDGLQTERDRLSRMLDTAVCEMAEEWEVHCPRYPCPHTAEFLRSGSQESSQSVCASCLREYLEEEDPTPCE